MAEPLLPKLGPEGLIAGGMYFVEIDVLAALIDLAAEPARGGADHIDIAAGIDDVFLSVGDAGGSLLIDAEHRCRAAVHARRPVAGRAWPAWSAAVVVVVEIATLVTVLVSLADRVLPTMYNAGGGSRETDSAFIAARRDLQAIGGIGVTGGGAALLGLLETSGEAGGKQLTLM